MLVNNKGKTCFIGAALSPGLNRLSPNQEKAFNESIKHRGNKELLDAEVIEVVKEEQKEKPKRKAKVQPVSASDVASAVASGEDK